eukprot:3922100-Heterocapsa_arctica.AAC.1
MSTLSPVAPRRMARRSAAAPEAHVTPDAHLAPSPAKERLRAASVGLTCKQLTTGIHRQVGIHNR